MERSNIRDGMKVRTTTLGETDGMIVVPRHLTCRGADRTGILSGFVTHHGGSVWWIQHDDDATIGAYALAEFEPA